MLNMCIMFWQNILIVKLPKSKVDKTLRRDPEGFFRVKWSVKTTAELSQS